MAGDLHIHTTFSDGKNTPEEILEMARAGNLRYIAITDHDTVDGVVALYEAGLLANNCCGPRIIKGIEMSAEHPTQEIHILGYNIDIYHKDLQESLHRLTEARWARFSKMIAKLNELGYEVTETEVLLQAGGVTASIGRSHLARTLVKKGYFDNIREAFEEVLKKGAEAYVPYYHMEVDEIIQLIKVAGGIPVLAHPKLVADDNLVEDVIARGIEGLEVYYPQHDAEDIQRYLALAKKYNLMITGGSDFHGANVRPPDSLGIFTIADELAEAIYQRA